MKDYYKKLELDRSASLSQIRNNYKRLLRQIRACNDEERKKAISEVLEAYDILKNPLTKRKYDILIGNEVSSSKRLKKTFSESTRSKYEHTVERKALRSSNKVDRLLNKSETKLEKDLNIGDAFFNLGELLEFVLNILSAIID